MKQKRIVLFVTGFILCIILILLFLTNSTKTCTWQDKERKISVNVPRSWTFQNIPSFQGDDVLEASPDYGLELYINGKQNNCIYLFYRLGTLSFREPGMTVGDFQTKEGKTGTLYTVSNDTETTLAGHFDMGNYGFISKLDNTVFEENKKAIFSVIKSIQIIEY